MPEEVSRRTSPSRRLGRSRRSASRALWGARELPNPSGRLGLIRVIVLRAYLSPSCSNRNRSIGLRPMIRVRSGRRRVASRCSARRRPTGLRRVRLRLGLSDAPLSRASLSRSPTAGNGPMGGSSTRRMEALSRERLVRRRIAPTATRSRPVGAPRRSEPVNASCVGGMSPLPETVGVVVATSGMEVAGADAFVVICPDRGRCFGCGGRRCAWGRAASRSGVRCAFRGWDRCRCAASAVRRSCAGVGRHRGSNTRHRNGGRCLRSICVGYQNRDNGRGDADGRGGWCGWWWWAGRAGDRGS